MLDLLKEQTIATRFQEIDLGYEKGEGLDFENEIKSEVLWFLKQAKNLRCLKTPKSSTIIQGYYKSDGTSIPGPALNITSLDRSKSFNFLEYL